MDDFPRESPPLDRGEFVRRVGITAAAALATAALALVVVKAADVFLLAFAAVLLAILLRSAADALARATGLSPNWAFAAVLLTLALGAAAGVYFVGATAADQFSKLTEELPKSVDRVRGYLQESAWGRELLRWAPAAQKAVAGQPEQAASNVVHLFSTTFGAAGDLVVLVFLTIYLAASPQKYIDGVVRLVPPPGRARAREVIETVGGRLKGWMLGQFVGMTVIGVLSGIGLKLIGVPQYLVLGLFAGLMTAIPYLGPIVGAVPGILAGLTQDGATALWAMGIYAAAEGLEGNVVTPLIQQKMSDLPPVLTLVAIALAGVLFGIPGLIVATPLAVALQTIVEELYIKDALGDRDDSTPTLS